MTPATHALTLKVSRQPGYGTDPHPGSFTARPLP